MQRAISVRPACIFFRLFRRQMSFNTVGQITCPPDDGVRRCVVAFVYIFSLWRFAAGFLCVCSRQCESSGLCQSSKGECPDVRRSKCWVKSRLSTRAQLRVRVPYYTISSIRSLIQQMRGLDVVMHDVCHAAEKMAQEKFLSPDVVIAIMPGRATGGTNRLAADADRRSLSIPKHYQTEAGAFSYYVRDSI